MIDLIQGDCLEVMRAMKGGTIDLIITSPPYNLRNTTGGYLKQNRESAQYPKLMMREGYDGHDDKMEHGEYVAWQRACLEEMMRLLNRGGRFSTIISGAFRPGCYKTERILLTACLSAKSSSGIAGAATTTIRIILRLPTK